MADVTSMLVAYQEADVSNLPAMEYKHVCHISPELVREVARGMNIPFTQEVERNKGIGGSDRHQLTLTCSREQHIWFREIYFQRASIN